MAYALGQGLKLSDETRLAPYAMRSGESRGRSHAIAPDRYRTEFQRDRDRIIHCAAFRKLEYKTQVYVIHEGDYYRTRLTHTLEVAQIARTLARCLGLNPDLTEAIALSHDLGHTPFGHSGEAALQKLLADLNLTWEVREGIAKHSTDYDRGEGSAFEPHLSPTLEAQICDLADEIAYSHHDIDDAMKIGFLREEQLREVDWVWDLWTEERAKLPSGVRPKFIKYRTIGRMMDMTIDDVVDHTAAMIEKHAIDSVERVRELKVRLAGFGPAMNERFVLLKRFLLEKVYQHPHIVRMQTKAERFVTRLFELYRETPAQLPRKYQARIETDGLDQVITDYISGMTDNFCMEEYVRAFEPTLHRPI